MLSGIQWPPGLASRAENEWQQHNLARTADEARRAREVHPRRQAVFVRLVEARHREPAGSPLGEKGTGVQHWASR